MKVWVVRDLEPLPIDGAGRRLMRAGMLSRELARAGHETKWITSSFDHYRKHNRLDAVGIHETEPNLEVVVLPGWGYRKNVSLSRILHNRRFARDLTAFANAATPRPDVIVTDIPTTEAAQAAIGLSRRWSIPSVVSIRDLWPDFFADHLPRAIRPIAAPALNVLRNQAKAACRDATALIGISRGYLDWGLALAGRREGPNDRIFPLGYAPIRLSASDAEARCRSLGVWMDGPIVSMVGSWGSTYDLSIVTKLAKLLPHITFVVAGDVSGQADFVEKLSEVPNVDALGWLDAEDIAALVTVSKVALLPYRSNAPQGLPNKVFEYLAYGAYQIATLSGEVEDFYSQTGCGIAIPSGDENQVAAVIAYVVANVDLQFRRKERIDLFNRKYSSTQIYSDMISHIESLVA
jgi:colanic acid biosynthesis glycosyl transferase WcaI